MFHRRRPVPELSSSNFMQRSFGERVAMNSPIQGTAADIIKIAMIRVHQRLKDEKLSSKLILQVHDELLIETKEEEKGTESHRWNKWLFLLCLLAVLFLLFTILRVLLPILLPVLLVLFVISLFKKE